MKRMIASKVHWLKRAVSTNSVGERVRLKIIETAPLHHIYDPVVRTRSVQDHVYRALEKKYGKIVAAAREPATETGGGELWYSENRVVVLASGARSGTRIRAGML